MQAIKISELPTEVKAYFDFNEEIFESIRSQLENQTRFEADYTPAEIELLLDDVVCGIMNADYPEAGIRIIRSPLSEHPETMEVKFDNQTALLIVRGYEVVNRLVDMCEFDLRANLSTATA